MNAQEEVLTAQILQLSALNIVSMDFFWNVVECHPCWETLYRTQRNTMSCVTVTGEKLWSCIYELNECTTRHIDNKQDLG